MRALIVEDEMVIAAEIEFILEDAGLTPIGVAIDSEEAIELVARERPDLVLLDIHLSDGPTGVELGRKVAAEYGAAVLFMTASRRRLPQDLAGAVGVVAKPYTAGGMRAALRFVRECLMEGEALRPPPSSLELAPAYVRRWRAPPLGHATH